MNKQGTTISDEWEQELFDALGGGPLPSDITRKDPKPKRTRVRRMLENARDLKPQGPTPFQSAHPAVVEWLEIYRGTFPFYLSLKQQYEQRGDLTERQCESIYKAIERDGIKVVKPVNGAALFLEIESLSKLVQQGLNHDGIVLVLENILKKYKPVTNAPVVFTIEAGESIRINKFHAKRIGEEAGLTRAHFVFEVTAVLSETAKAYRLKLKAKAQRSGHCCVCGLKLTNPESVAKGIGPDCGDGYQLNWSSDKDALMQLSEKLAVFSEIETWIPKGAIKERYGKGEK